MSIGNVNNNGAAQLQFYAQEKNAISTKAEQTTQTLYSRRAVYEYGKFGRGC